MAGMRRIAKLRVWYDDGSMEKWDGEGLGSVHITDTELPPPVTIPPTEGAKATPISFITATLPIPARRDLNGKPIEREQVSG